MDSAPGLEGRCDTNTGVHVLVSSLTCTLPIIGDSVPFAWSIAT
jgi:hypothetical protein